MYIHQCERAQFFTKIVVTILLKFSQIFCQMRGTFWRHEVPVLEIRSVLSIKMNYKTKSNIMIFFAHEKINHSNCMFFTDLGMYLYFQ